MEDLPNTKEAIIRSCLIGLADFIASVVFLLYSLVSTDYRSILNFRY